MNKKKISAELFLLVLLSLVLMMTILINRNVALHILDDDASSEMVYSDLVHEEKNFFSDDWYYSTELMFHNQIVFSFLFYFFDGWANVRFLGTCIIQGIYLVSYIFMMSQSGLSRRSVILGSVLLMLPYCVSYGRSVLYHCFYIFKSGPGFILLGLLFSFLKKPDASRLSRMIRLVLIGLISFINSFLYVRQFFTTMLPLLGCLFFFLLSHSDENRTPYKRFMFIPVFMTVAGGLGMISNSIFLIPRLNLLKQTDQYLNVLQINEWSNILTAYLAQFSFRMHVKLFSIAGLLSLGGLFNAGIITFSSVRTLFRMEYDFRRYILSAMLPVSVFVNLIIFVFGDIPYRSAADYSRYFVLASVWMIPFICCWFEKSGRLPHIKRIFFLAALCFFLLNGLFNGNSFMHQGNFGQPYDGLTYENPHLVDDLQSAVEYIRVHNYSYGYSFLGSANILVEILNGIPVVPLHRTNTVLEYDNWTTRKSFKTVKSDNAFFLMKKDDETYYSGQLAEAGAEKVYFDDQGYVIFDIPDVDRFRNMIQEPFENR